MQWKLARPSRLAHRLHRWAIRAGFPRLARIAPRWPRWWLFLNARWVIFLIMAVYPKPRFEVARNLARVLGRPVWSLRVQRSVSRMFRHFAFYWVDMFRFPQLPPERGRELLAGVEGEEHLDRALAEGAGVILLTGHLGNWELGSILLGQKNLPISVVYVPDQFEVAESFRSQLRGRAEVEEIPLAPGSAWGSLPVLRALRSGRVVAMQGDRDFDEKGVPATFFGEPVRFPRGPFIVAQLTGAAVVPTFLTYERDYRFRATFGQPIRVRRDLPRDEAIEEAVRAWAVVLEGAVRRWPSQWYTFFDYWRVQGGPAPAAGTSSGPSALRPREAAP